MNFQKEADFCIIFFKEIQVTLMAHANVPNLYAPVPVLLLQLILSSIQFYTIHDSCQVFKKRKLETKGTSNGP